MNPAAELALENAALRDRLSRLSAASLRINESLDFDAVLQEVLDSVRSLTSARYGAITTTDAAGGVEDVVTSGLTAEEHEGLWAIPGGQKIFESLSQIPTALRLLDLGSYARVLGSALDRGAADYVVKPFAPTELAARIRAVLRGGTATPRPEAPLRRGRRCG